MKKIDFDFEKMGCFIFNISRSEVEKNDFTGMDALMAMFEKDTKTYENNIELMFDGYNEDKRELVEIQEVRTFCKVLLTKYPHLPYFIKSEYILANILSCAQGLNEYSPKKDRFEMSIRIDKELLNNVVIKSMEYMRFHNKELLVSNVNKDKKVYALANKITDSIGLERIPFGKSK